MVDFEMPMKDGGYIEYDGQENIIRIQDSDLDLVEIDVNELIRFTNTNFWKHLSKSNVEQVRTFSQLNDINKIWSKEDNKL